MSHRKTINRLTYAALNNMMESMSDEQLTAIIGTDPDNLSDFSNAEISTIASGTAGPELTARFDAATTQSTRTKS